jgi:hypothetical protein
MGKWGCIVFVKMELFTCLGIKGPESQWRPVRGRHITRN